MKTKVDGKPLSATGCRHCGGSLIRDGEELKCLNCGRAFSSNIDTGRFIEQNKEEIQDDVKRLGVRKTMEKWRLSPSTLHRLRRRWEIILPARSAADPPAARGQQLPPLPEFRDEWEPSVQERWLTIWLYLVTRDHAAGSATVHDQHKEVSI